MYIVKFTTSFKRERKKMQKRGVDMEQLNTIINKLRCGEPLPPRHKDHTLVGNFIGHRECHIQPDWLLIYKIDNGALILTLLHTGTHSDLFDK